MYLKSNGGMANSVDPDQTAPRSSLIRVHTVCSGPFVRILRVIKVNPKIKGQKQTIKCIILLMFGKF